MFYLDLIALFLLCAFYDTWSWVLVSMYHTFILCDFEKRTLDSTAYLLPAVPEDSQSERILCFDAGDGLWDFHSNLTILLTFQTLIMYQTKGPGNLDPDTESHLSNFNSWAAQTAAWLRVRLGYSWVRYIVIGIWNNLWSIIHIILSVINHKPWYFSMFLISRHESQSY